MELDQEKSRSWRRVNYCKNACAVTKRVIFVHRTHFFGGSSYLEFELDDVRSRKFVGCGGIKRS